MLLRSFLPVGQGAFYHESFWERGFERPINVVYDCGSHSGLNYVEREIRHNFDKGEVIDAVFLSHLDEDHVNGIPYLLKHCKVKRIFFPLISSDDKVMLKLYFKIHKINGFLSGFLTNPRGAIRDFGGDEDTELIQVRTNEDDQNNNIRGNDGDMSIIDSGTNVFDHMKGKSGTSSIYGSFEWLYIPHNFKQPERKECLMDKLEDEFKRKISVEEVEDIWENGLEEERKKIKEAYKKVPGGLNTNSMTVFSGRIDDVRVQWMEMKGCRCRICFRSRYDAKPLGCLFTGDYEASGPRKWKSLKDAYKAYWDYIGCVQVPHHGSSHNFNSDLLDLDAFFIISAGTSNRHGHPHGSVLRRMLLRGIEPYIVTEDERSKVYIRVNFI